jgi:ABC-2 type transport system ATP-binding protein
MDEPLDGLDANTAMVIKELLKQMAAQGKTILFCSHILEVVDRMCSKIVIIDKGRLVASGTSEDLKKSTGESTLEGAFGKLTGHQDVGRVAADFMSALQDK